MEKGQRYFIMPQVQDEGRIPEYGNAERVIAALKSLIETLGGKPPTIQIAGQRCPFLCFTPSAKSIAFSGANSLFPDFPRQQFTASYKQFIDGLDVFVDPTRPQDYLDMLAGKPPKEPEVPPMSEILGRYPGPRSSERGRRSRRLRRPLRDSNDGGLHSGIYNI